MSHLMPREPAIIHLTRNHHCFAIYNCSTQVSPSVLTSFQVGYITQRLCKVLDSACERRATAIAA